MNRAPLVVALICSSAALAANYASGEVMVVEDLTGAQHDPENLAPLVPFGTNLCEFAAKGLYSQFADDYDGVVMFTTHPMNTMELGIHNTMLGNIVRQTAQGISDQPFASLTGNPATAYGSPAKLGQCVFMGSLGQLPANPDDQATTLFGGILPLPMGITATELMGHEYGHHWLVWATYDKNDGLGKRYLMRGDTGDATNPMDIQPNGHWNHYSDARSVMYGSFITPQGPGSYLLEGGIRKYNEFDQYFMGLRAPSEVSPILIVDDGSGRGAAVQPFWRTGGGLTMAGTGLTVDVQDVIRAIGARNPSVTTSQKCFRVAFALVTHAGHTATAAEIAKVDNYRQRFQTWFTFATDGRANMDTALTGPPGCQVGDGGVVVVDAGVVDAGVGSDAGTDGGRAAVTDAGGVVDAGTDLVDSGTPELDAGHVPTKDETRVGDNRGYIKPGCGCGSTAPGAFVLLALLALGSKRRAARVS